MNTAAAVLGVAAAVLAVIVYVQYASGIKMMAAVVLYQMNLGVTVLWAGSTTAGHFYKKYYMEPDVIPEKRQ